MSRSVLVMLGVVMVMTVSTKARGEDPPPLCIIAANNQMPITPRLASYQVAGETVTVLVPPSYATSTRRYPVLYLFHGAFGDEHEFTAETDLIPFTAALPDDQQAIVVTARVSYLMSTSDFRDRAQLHETFVIEDLIPWVDSTFRTLSDRGHRVAAGFSGGGMNAMMLTARHPDLFVTAASFSGFVDQLTPRGIAVVIGFSAYDGLACDEPIAPFSIWGDPVTDEIWWRSHDPTDLAPSLRDHALYVASGDGMSCPDDAQPVDGANPVLESTVLEMSQHLDAALTAAAIPHVTDFYGCGLHSTKYAQRDLHRWWPQMVAAFGTPTPSVFDYRNADPLFTVYGWWFVADPLRALEFTYVDRASAHGLVLRGSGQETMTTAPYFPPHHKIAVVGASSSTQFVTADDSGAITFTADLGTPHPFQQYSAMQKVVEATTPGYFTFVRSNFGACG